MPRSPLASAALLMALIPALVLPGCNITNNAYDRVTGKEPFTPVSQEELWGEITALVNNFTAMVEKTAVSIESDSPSTETRVRMLAWRIDTVQEMQSLLGVADARHALTDLWIFLLQARAFMDTPGGTKEYGVGLPKVQALIDDLIQDVEAIAASVISPEDMPGAKQTLQDYVAKNPLQGVTGRSPLGDAVRSPSDSTTLGSIVRAPLAPFKVFEGVDKGAAALRDFSLIGNRFTTIVQGMPQQLAWQTEWILLSLERAPAIASTTASLDRASKAADSIAKTADTLPAELGKEVRATLDEIAAKQGDIQRMLDGAQATATGFDTTAKSLTVALKEATETTNAINRVFIEPDPNAPPPSPDDPPIRPFNITEYTDTANGVTQMAVELRQTVESVDALLADLDERSADLEQVTAATVDHIKWSAIQVVGALLAAALIYRVVARRMAA